MIQLTRREFLELAARQSVGASVAATAFLAACAPTADRSAALGLNADATNTLIALVDEIIPAWDGAPAASEAGTLAYLEMLAATETELPETLRAAIRLVDALSVSRVGQGLAAVGRDGRAAVIAAFAEAERALFGRVRNYVYEGYYLQPRVWQQLGYEPFPTLAAGPVMAPFDAAMLDRVRTMPARYRKV